MLQSRIDDILASVGLTKDVIEQTPIQEAERKSPNKHWQTLASEFNPEFKGSAGSPPNSTPSVRAHPGRLSALAFSTVNRFCMALLYGRVQGA